jgi:hypothetical protein
MRDTEQMITELSLHLSPVRPAGDSWKPALGLWLASFAAVALVFVSWLKPRPELQASLGTPVFVARAICLIFGAFLSVLAVQKLAIPGRARSGRQSFWALSIPALLGCALALQALFQPSALQLGGAERACTEATLALGALPALLLMIQVKRSAPTHPGWVGSLIGASSSLLASAALSFHCSNDQPLHLLTWHLVLPLTLASGAGFLAGRRLLCW